MQTQILISPGQVLTLQNIIDQLNTKISQIQLSNPKNVDNKYANALKGVRNAINNNSSIQGIVGILNDNSIKFNKDDKITGGKQSRKTKKRMRRRRQKGGYQYNEKSKRRRFTTSTPNSSTSRRSSKTTSSLNKDKSKTRKTL